MIVSAAKYEKLKRENEDLLRFLNEKIDEWNKLVRIINGKGGQAFLDRAVLLSKEDINTLIQLVHPDKHQGKESATRMTQLLLTLRK